MVLTHCELFVLTLTVALAIDALLDALYAGVVLGNPVGALSSATRKKLITRINQIALRVLLRGRVVARYLSKGSRLIR